MWPVFSLVLSYSSGWWEQLWTVSPCDQVYEKFILFLSLLESRCRIYFPLKRARPSVPMEIVKLLAQSRKLSFRANMTGNIRIRREAQTLRNQARFELKRFQQNQLVKSLRDRNTPGENTTMFCDKLKRQFKSVSSTFRRFMRTNGEITKDPKEMANIAADYYEKLFEAPVVVRPHFYVDSLPLYNQSFSNGYVLRKLKEVRIIMLAKKTALCSVDQTDLSHCWTRF